MTKRERFIETLKGNKIGGQVPHFELVFFLTMEAFGRIHPQHRNYSQWGQMSYAEQKLHIEDKAEVYIESARRYDHSAILVQEGIGKLDETIWLLETIREKSGDEFYLSIHGDPTWDVPDGDNMLDFSAKMYEEPEELNEISERRVERHLESAHKIKSKGNILDGFTLCSDYALNANPFFPPDKFEELNMPYLKRVIEGYREQGLYAIKHTDGNIMPILKMIADCNPHAIHSLDPQGGVTIPEVRRIIGDDICLIGNVNCGLLQTGSEEECVADIHRSLREGMDKGRGYIFSTSNCAYTGLPLERYELMVNIWREHGSYKE